MAGENFGELQANLAKKTLANLSPASTAFSDIISNWQIKVWRICSKSPNSPKFSPAKIFPYMVSIILYVASIDKYRKVHIVSFHVSRFDEVLNPIETCGGVLLTTKQKVGKAKYKTATL